MHTLPLPKLSSYIFLWLILLPGLIAQGQNTDSLRQAVKSAKDDSTKVNLLNALAWELKYENPDTAILLAEQALSVAKITKWVPGYYISCNKLGVFNGIKGNYPGALTYHTQALSFLREFSTRLSLKMYQRYSAQTFSNMALVYQEMGAFPKALEFHLKALKIDEEQGNRDELVRHYGNIGNIFAMEGEYKQALEYFTKALHLAEILKNKPLISTWLGNIGNVYKDKGDYNESYPFYRRALEIDRQLNNKNGIARHLGNIGTVYEYRNKYDSAMHCYLQAIDLFKETGVMIDLTINYNSAGNLYQKKENSNLAEQYYLKSLKLSELSEDMYGLMETNELLSNLYAHTHKYQLALSHYRRHILYRDSLFNEENTRKMIQSQMQYEFDKRESATKLAQEKKEVVAAAERKRQRIILWAISGFGLLVFTFAIFAYRSYRQKQRANVEITKQKHLIEEKQKEILDSIYYARRIQRSLMTNERYISKALDRLTK